jgi:hypothetical protein
LFGVTVDPICQSALLHSLELNSDHPVADRDRL